jgi:tetratricopeptide (TPR) repeat protein
MSFDHFRFTLRATLFEWLGQSERALAAWESCARLRPENTIPVRSIAWIHAQKHRWEAAAEWFERAVALEPGHADSWFNLGYAREKLGQTEAALKAFGRCAELNPKHDRAWYGTGMILAHKGEHGRAVEFFERAAELQPFNGAAWHALGMAYHHTHQPDAVKRVIEHCLHHDGPAAKRLIHDAQRSDLTHLLE